MSDVKRIGRYEVGTLIAKGAVGAVYRGESDGKLFALKLVHANQVAPERLAQLREAAAAMARVRHPAVVPFVEVIEHAKALCLVSEMAEGEPLSALLKAGDFPDLRRAWDIMRQVLEALEVAHGRGVFHGSLKPANVFIDRTGRVAVSDFAIAGLAAGDAAGPDFMAPEQLTDGLADARTDVYQAGALAYLLVTRHPPFAGPREEVAHRVVQERPVDPSSLAKRIAWQLDWVVQRALSKDPADRFGGAREFMDGLRLGLQESLGSPLPVAKAPDTPAAPPPAKPPAPRVKPTPPEAALAQKAKIIAAKPSAPTKPAPAPAKPRVLFVDDDERVLNALATLFRGDEYDVSIAVGGAAALEFLKANPVQIVVSDQRMPGMAGVDLLREVKKAMPRTVRILLTGYSDLAAMVGSINEGEVFRFVKKPWDNDEIRGVMKEAAAVAAKLPPPVPAKLQAPRVAASLLVIDTDTSLAKGLQRMLGAEATVHEAASAAEAAKILQAHDVAAVVADLRAGATGIVSLFKLLKAKRPNTLTILLSDQPDSEVVTELINQAHVHRFLAKPLNGRALHGHVTEALQRYSGLAQGVASLPEGLVPNLA